jgi:hypothetical protein
MSRPEYSSRTATVCGFVFGLFGSALFFLLFSAAGHAARFGRTGPVFVAIVPFLCSWTLFLSPLSRGLSEPVRDLLFLGLLVGQYACYGAFLGWMFARKRRYTPWIAVLTFHLAGYLTWHVTTFVLR